MSSPNFPEVKAAIEKWWCNMQFERKCSSTNTVQKIINNSSQEIQLKVRHVISEEIQKILEKCYKSNDLKNLQCACNAINGCFDNFIHAVDAVRLLFFEIISFIDFGLNESQVKLNLRSNQKNAVLELLHSLSRILILVLKLKRTQNVGKVKNITQDTLAEDLSGDEKIRHLLSALTCKIGQFLIMDDILIDTKNNLSMSGILIREILFPEEEDLIMFHKSFVNSLPVSLSDEDFKLNVLRFLTCSAIINTWSVNIVDCHSTCVYLKFFISLCEKYSSETPIVLNTSRTLLLMVKHEAFKNFVNSTNYERTEQIISMLLSCIFMLLEHPVACVRHSARDFLQLLATHPTLHSVMIDSVFKLPTDKRSYFISIGALANEIGSEVLIKHNPELPAQLITALCDPTIVSHVSLALEFVLMKDSQKNFSNWCETYVVPLLISLQTVLPIVAADIEKLLEKAFKKHPNSVLYVINKWSNPKSGEELRYVVTALKISQKQGYKIKESSFNNLTGENEKTNKTETQADGEDDLISERLLEHCLHQRDDDIRISAFSLLIEAHKTTKPYSDRDFKLIQYFLKYNLNNQQPATRQKILGLIRKMFVRFSASQKQAERSKNSMTYDQFLDSLVAFCFTNIFVGCNFNRLNTVLNILLLSFENIKDMSFDKGKTDFYWSKFLIALDSSYEENKELATVLIKKLDLSLLEANNPKSAKLLYDKAFSLCTHMEPPDVLTGSYLLQALLNLPSSKEVLSSYFAGDYVSDDVYYYCIQVLLQKLKEQIQLAKLDLMTAATCGPMYGALFAIRLTFKNVNFSVLKDQSQGELILAKWAKILNELVDLCFEMTRIVGCVVNSSSPEGHLPMDFQTDVDSLLSLDFKEKCEIKGLEESSSAKYSPVQLIKLICANFFNKCNKIASAVENPDCDTYESLRSIKALLKENQLLISQIQANKEAGRNNADEYNLLNLLRDTKGELESHLERLQKLNAVIEWPATAQVLLLCAWRSIKEASLFLGELFTELPVETEIELGLLTKDTIIRVGEELKILLCEIKHRGAFEHAYIGFTHLVNSLWKCSDKNLSNLPKQWLLDITNQLESPLSDQKVKLCSTRRSAGLPFLVQAIICSEVISLKATTPSSLHSTMKSLLSITENGVLENPDSKIHALNVLRALFKHAQLGEHVASYVSRALMMAIRGSRASTWSERNSSSLLFSSLIIRIFGVSRSRDEISKKNRMTSRTFFQRYSELYDFLLSEMELVYSKENYVDGLYPKPSLYLVLLILGRLYPPPTEDPENIDLSEFLPYINMSRRNPTMKIRELGARALVPLISLDRLKEELDDRFAVLSSNVGITENERHGVLLQIKELLSQSRESLGSLSKERSEMIWLENTKWLLDCPKQICLGTLSTYVKVLHILYKNFVSLREMIGVLMRKTPIVEYLLKLGPFEQSFFPGINLFLENYFFLKTEVLAWKWLNLKDRQSEEFIELLMFMLNCEVSEVQSIPLRIFSFVFRENLNFSSDYDDDDFSGIGAPMNDLLFVQSKENVKLLQREILTNREILNFLTEHINNEGDAFKSVVIHRIWLSVISTLVMSDVIPISHSVAPAAGYLSIDFAKSLIKSRDKGLSTSALICYAIYLMEEVSVKEGMPSEDRCLLADIVDEFSGSDADVKERLAVAKIMNRCCGIFPGRKMISDPVILKIWMIPFRLIADEDPTVRLASGELVQKIQEQVLKDVPGDKLLMKMKTLDWPHLPLVSLKAQESLLDSYINILGVECLLNLIVQMLIMALSAFNEPDAPEKYSKDEFGVFEKGNPNPFCEDLALSNLMCRKLIELKSVTDLESFMWSNLDNTLAKYVVESLYIQDFIPQNLMEVVEMVTTTVEETQKLNGEYSVPRLQVRNLREALGLPEVL